MNKKLTASWLGVLFFCQSVLGDSFTTISGMKDDQKNFYGINQSEDRSISNKQIQAKGTLILQTDEDADVTLYINGQPQKLMLKRGVTNVMTLDAGEHVFVFEGAAFKQRHVRTIVPGKQSVLNLTFTRPADFISGADGTIMAAGVEWTPSDNGTDINWNEAKAYCDGKGGGWRLPLAVELKVITYNSFLAPCGNYDGKPLTCRVSPKFQLTGGGFWSKQKADSSNVWMVGLTDGEAYHTDVNYRHGVRVLCVRAEQDSVNDQKW